MFCREHVVQLHLQSERIRAAGADLHVIGSGTPNFIAGFRETTKFDGSILSDPSLKSYQAAGLLRSGWRTFHPMAAVSAARALARGNMQGRTQGDNFQQGGVVVILPPGEIAYAHVSKHAGDNASGDEVATALEAALKPAAPPPAAP
jgi:hypothetical protein